MAYHRIIRGERFAFADLREVFGRANEEKSGDRLAGVAARSETERVAAKLVLADVRLTHPQIWQGGSREHSPEYALDAALDQCNQPLVTNPAAVTYTVSEPADLAGARKCGDRYGRLLGMSADQVADLMLVATELATNSLDHAGGGCRLAFWYEAGYVVCEARDMGYWADPLAGRRPPTAHGIGPYGLFVVNTIADLLRTHTTPAGTTVQVYLRLPHSDDGRAV